MKPIDPQKEARVWQRVQGNSSAPSSTPQGGTLQRLLVSTWSAAAVYLQLSRQVPSKEASILQRLFRESQSQSACLKGIYTLITGEKPVIQTPPPQKEPPIPALQKCYRLEMRTWKEFESQTQDGEYGPVFSRLAEQKRAACQTVLELIGSLQGSR